MNLLDLNRTYFESLAKNEGLFLFGLVRVEEDLVAYKRFLAWLEEKGHAEMAYMEKYKDLRKDPRLLLEGAKSALILGYNYHQGDSIKNLHDGQPRIAQYARLKDYHKFLRKKSESILKGLREKNPQIKARILVDTAPCLEKALAEKSSQGFIGKNSLYIHPEKGSYFSLVEILLDVELDYDEKKSVDPEERTKDGGCGSCRRCAVFCPTGALDKAYSLDSKKCLSYYTIEHRGTVPFEFWPHFKKYFFGCDICQLVCPYNRGVSLTEKIYQKLPPSVDLFEVATMDQKFYEDLFGGTPLTRAKKEGLQRNALIAMTVTGDSRLEEALEVLKGEVVKPVLLDTLLQIRDYRKKKSVFTRRDSIVSKKSS